MRAQGLRRRLPLLLLPLLLAVLFLLPLFPAAAGGTSLHSIHIDIRLLPDGSAEVTELWDVTAGSDNTEIYKIMSRLMLGKSISNFSVTDENGTQFETLPHWDVEASREEKAYKCGLVEANGGYELCWGFGEPGRHNYTLRYTFTGLVQGYEDYDGMVQNFLADASGGLESVSMRLHADGISFGEGTNLIWLAGAEGNTEGEIQFQDGQVVALAAPFSSSSRFDIMMQFEKGQLAPIYENEGNFETMREDMLSEASWDNDNSTLKRIGVVLLLIVCALVLIPLIIWGIVKGIQFNNKIRGYKAAEYCRSLPWQGSIPATYARLRELHQLGDDSALFGAYILRWLSTRQIDIQAETNWRGKETAALKLYAPRPEMLAEEAQLYSMLMSAAGGDGILQEKEFQKWSERNHTQPQAWLEYMRNYGKGQVRSMGAIQDVPARAMFIFPYTKSEYNELGEKLTSEMFGFQKYLEDFTIINEREAREVELWDEYLVFAQLFGIADRVAQQFRQLLPRDVDSLGQSQTMYGGHLTTMDYVMISHLSRSYGQAMRQGLLSGNAAASGASGSGGSMGGGGFSAGGGGGAGGR